MSELVAFAKHWHPGEAKTRLGAVIGMEPAAEFQRWCVERVLKRLAGVTERSTLWFSPTERIDAFREILPPGWELQPQVSGDLGERLAEAFREAFERSDGPVLAIGTDTPELTAERIGEALESLARSDMVMGPASDGGYYLIGLARPCAEIFRKMPWSSSQLSMATWERARELGLVCERLPEMHDVDEVEDLRSLWERVSREERVLCDEGWSEFDAWMRQLPSFDGLRVRARGCETRFHDEAK